LDRRGISDHIRVGVGFGRAHRRVHLGKIGQEIAIALQVSAAGH